MITIGIAGTAKNTGKTTALVALLEQAARRGLSLGLTGIGYDGEERDTVTLLPKPRIRVPAGAFVTTSESCLQATDAQWTDLRRTGFRTALGEVVVVRVTAPGLLVVAGPNKTHELELVRQRLADERLELLMVDGSLNRIAPMAVADRLVFSTGAARSTDLRAVVREMEAIELLFGIPRWGGEGGGETREEGAEGVKERKAPGEGTERREDGDTKHREDGEAKGSDEASGWPVVTAGFSAEDAVRVASRGSGVVRWKGLVALDLLLAMTPVLGPRRATVLFDDPLKLLLAGDIRRVAEAVASARSAGVLLACRRVPRLAAVTSNPFYPAYDGTVYSGSAVDAAGLQTALRAAISVPVVDVVRDGGETLFREVWPA